MTPNDKTIKKEPRSTEFFSFLQIALLRQISSLLNAYFTSEVTSTSILPRVAFEYGQT